MNDPLRALLAGCLAAAAGSAPCAASNAQQTIGRPTSPIGVRVERSGFWTIERAPNSPAAAATPLRPSGKTIYAEIAGVSNEEAEKRLREQDAMRPEFERLMAKLRAREQGNYTDVELIHRPDWAYLIYFKHAPRSTLAKYTKNPRFQARSAPYTQAELKKLIEPWINRLSGERLFTGFGLNARQGRADVDMVVSEDEVRAVARRRGWGEPPGYIHLKFDDAPVGLDVEPTVARGVRILAHGDRNLGLTHEAAFGGRIVLRDGCLLVIGLDRSEKLAYFAREVGLGRDSQGYLSLHRRSAVPEHLGRIGEEFTWPGPIPIDESAPMVKQLRERCGNAPLMHVGIPNSTAMFNARWGLPRAAPPPPPTRRPPFAPKTTTGAPAAPTTSPA
jgi:hypothetical protein